MEQVQENANLALQIAGDALHMEAVNVIAMDANMDMDQFYQTMAVLMENAVLAQITVLLARKAILFVVIVKMALVLC